MMTVIVTACSSFGLTVSEAKTEIMCLETKCGRKVSFTINSAGQVYKQKIEFVYLGGAITAERNVRTETTRVSREPGRASSGTRWKSIIARVCAYG